jgi:hypothetical protein
MFKKMQTEIVATYVCPVCNSVLQVGYLENSPYCSCKTGMELVAASVVSETQAAKILERRKNYLREKNLTSKPLLAGAI